MKKINREKKGFEKIELTTNNELSAKVINLLIL